MAGQIIADAPHLDGSEDIGVWFDVAWRAYTSMAIQFSTVDSDAIEDLWDKLNSVSDDGKPTAEEWGTSERAQRSQAGLMAMFGGSPEMGVAPGIGDET